MVAKTALIDESELLLSRFFLNYVDCISHHGESWRKHVITPYFGGRGAKLLAERIPCRFNPLCVASHVSRLLFALGNCIDRITLSILIENLSILWTSFATRVYSLLVGLLILHIILGSCIMIVCCGVF